ncbi:MAG: S8 family serine peptidase [Acidobacteria bacterium]|nr:S8 family serine peptidase [Acidobacteriota bacterium]
MSRRVCTSSIRTLLLLAFLVPPSTMAAKVPVEVQPWVLDHTADGSSAEFFVVLREQANLAEADTLTTKEERGTFVFGALVRTARRSQSSLRSWLEEHHVWYRPFYIVNAILVRGDRQLVETLARRPDVLRIEGNPHIQNRMPTPVVGAHGSEPNGVEWGIARTNAPDVWAMGFTGQGIVIGGQDTGIDWTHPAIKGKYRGWDGANADHDYNWHDAIHDSVGNPCGNDSPFPCDDYGHGTHTIGTVVGDDGGGNQIGMAPGAKWIGCRNMDNGAGTPARYLECFEFFLAPYPVGATPSEGDPSKAPDVTNNSWGCPTSEGCSWDTLKSALEAQRAAGIMTIVSAGNDGPSCGSVTDAPAIYDAAYSVGASTSSDGLASFSSRGPASTNQGDPNLLKPDIVAPGVGVRSCVPGGGYQSWQGTSMAGPHVAGAVALIWSAKPSLKNDQAATETLLNSSAYPLASVVESCGGDYVSGPNNSWGYGLVDVQSALAEDITLQATAVGVTETSGNANGILEPGEVFSLSPTWFNPGTLPVPSVTGSSSMASGLLPAKTTASYGAVPGGAPASCSTLDDCYSARVATTRPTGHLDRMVTETLSTGETHDWVLHIGESFADVPDSRWEYPAIETLYHHGLTAGCGSGNFCPDVEINRQEMAVQILRAMGVVDQPVWENIFSDMPACDPDPAVFCWSRWAEELFRQGISAGCSYNPATGERRFCPLKTLPRREMAVQILRSLGVTNQPVWEDIFSDMPACDPDPAVFCWSRWAEEYFRRGITAGCYYNTTSGERRFCPLGPVPRSHMAVFLVRSFDLPLYQP